MSIKVMQWVWDCSRSRNAGRLVLLAIADCASEDGGNAYPSNAELQRKAGLTDRGVQLAVKGLVELGELDVQLNGGRRGTNMYRVIMKPGARRTPEKSSPPGTGPREGTPEESSPPPPKNLPPTPEESSDGTVLEPSLEPSSTTSFDAEASPTAQTIIKGFIDWLALPQQGEVKLSKRVIGIYAKSIKTLLGEGFSKNLIKLALAEMHTKGMTGRPTLLEGFVVQVQQTRPVSAPPASFRRQDAEDREREELILKAMAQLLDEQPDLKAAAAREIVMEMIKNHEIDLNRLRTNAATGYIDGDVIDSEVKEVTGR